jgi:serine/threonine-protein kinase
MADTSSDRELLLNHLADEFAARYRRGEQLSLREYVDQYPELADDIRELFPALVEIEQIKLDAGGAETAAAAPPLKELGDYRILREIGRGGMGVVYEAEQVSLGRHVALKLLLQKRLLDTKTRLRFEREAKAAAKLHHTNIVPVFGIGEHDGLPYFVMQYIQGLGLDQVINDLKQFTQDGITSGQDLSPQRSSKTRAAGDAQRPQPTERTTRSQPNEVSTGNLARSLVSGAFERPSNVEDDKGEQAEKRTKGQRADAHPSSMGLRGHSRSSSDSGTRRATYWRSVAEIGVQVASALDYAHRQGVLHRDIKPSNLLLDTHGTVWVTDFGLAKADDQDALTQSGDVVGTLRYLPPEAFEGKSDARGDVYCLGLTLYELLALRPAFDVSHRRRVRMPTSDADPIRLDRENRAIPRDLVTIVHRAIEHDPTHRYQTAAELEADLHRFLADEPILARRPSMAERLWRWARHHPGVAASLTAILLLLLVGLVGATFAAGRFRRIADDNRQLAMQRESERSKAESERSKAEQEKERAEASFKMARDTVDRFFTQVGESPELKARGMEKFRKSVLQNAKEFYERFIREQLDAPEVRRDLGLAHLRLAKIQHDLGDYGSAQIHAEKAGDILSTLARAHPDVSEYERDRAACYFELGTIYFDTGHLDQAGTAYQQAMTMQQKLVGEHPEAAEYRRALGTTQNSLAVFYIFTDQLEKAQASLEQALAMWTSLVHGDPIVPEDRHGLANAQQRLGATYMRRGQTEKAEATLKQAETNCQTLVRDFPDGPVYRQSLGWNYFALANLYFNDLQDAEKAEAALHETLAIFEKLAQEHPDVLEYARQLGRCYMLMAATAQLARRSEAALTRCEKAIEIFERVIGKGNNRAQNDLLNSRAIRAGVIAARGDHVRATAEANDVARNENLNSVILYALVCAFAQASAAAANDTKLLPAEQVRLKAQNADRAMEFLHQAIAKGFQSIPLLKNDRDLAPLRAREDFKKIVREVEKKIAK